MSDSLWYGDPNRNGRVVPSYNQPFFNEVGSGSGLVLGGRIRIWIYSRRSDADPVFFYEGRIRVKLTRNRNPAYNPSVRHCPPGTPPPPDPINLYGLTRKLRARSRYHRRAYE